MRLSRATKMFGGPDRTTLIHSQDPGLESRRDARAMGRWQLNQGSFPEEDLKGRQDLEGRLSRGGRQNYGPQEDFTAQPPEPWVG